MIPIVFLIKKVGKPNCIHASQAFPLLGTFPEVFSNAEPKEDELFTETYIILNINE